MPLAFTSDVCEKVASDFGMKSCLTHYSIDTHFNTSTNRQINKQTALENIMGKEEIARSEQFLLFPQCFLLNQKIVPLACEVKG